MSESEQEIAIENIGHILVENVSPKASAKDTLDFTRQRGRPRKIWLWITLCALLAALFGSLFTLFLVDRGNSPSFMKRKVILNTVPEAVKFVDPSSGKKYKTWDVEGTKLQVEYLSEFRSVGWVSFVTDQGQTMLDLVSIGSSMATFEKGISKTFPVLISKPNVKSGYHMVIVLCTDAFAIESRPRFQEIESFMRISAMGGRLPRADCSSINFRI
jgi:hypothetical protein